VVAAEKILERRPIAGLRSFNQLVIGGAFGDARSVPVVTSRAASAANPFVCLQFCALYRRVLLHTNGSGGERRASADGELGHAGGVRRTEIGDPEQDGARLPPTEVEIDSVAGDALFDGDRLTP
jgi:hypothetical protein